MSELLFKEEVYQIQGALFEVYKELGCGLLGKNLGVTYYTALYFKFSVLSGFYGLSAIGIKMDISLNFM